MIAENGAPESDQSLFVPRCLDCGYDLSGLADGKCPECGPAERGRRKVAQASHDSGCSWADGRLQNRARVAARNRFGRTSAGRPSWLVACKARSCGRNKLVRRRVRRTLQRVIRRFLCPGRNAKRRACGFPLRHPAQPEREGCCCEARGRRRARSHPRKRRATLPRIPKARVETPWLPIPAMKSLRRRRRPSATRALPASVPRRWVGQNRSCG